MAVNAARLCRIILVLGLGLPTARAWAEAERRPAIVSISVCSPDGLGGQGSCPPGSLDTHQIVLAPDGSGQAINSYLNLGGISDEHSTAFPPESLGENGDYLFFVASRTNLSSDTGVVVLSGGPGPDAATGQWTFDLPAAYGAYETGFGQVLLSPVGRGCPAPPNGDVTQQDQTFDLNYAAAGSLVKDPTSPGKLLMVYEGTNKCPGLGLTSSADSGAYISAAIATSLDFGRTWPTYSSRPWFDFVPLPGQNPSQGPRAPFGALGDGVYFGNDTSSLPPPDYGRYAVLTPPVPLADIVLGGTTLQGTILGDGEPSAFVDDARGDERPYLYLIHGYSPGGFGDPPLPGNRASDLTIARARLGRRTPLRFAKWNGQSFTSPGLGGSESPILPEGDYTSCGAAGQSRHMASIYHVAATQQYLLIFVCDSPTDPKSGQGTGAAGGAAWFFSTSDDLTDPSRWSTPTEIAGSWSPFGAPATAGGPSAGDGSSAGCPFYKGWYPSFMSLGAEPGHLATSGFAFYLWGCQGDGTPAPGRQFSSRAFTITLQ